MLKFLALFILTVTLCSCTGRMSFNLGTGVEASYVDQKADVTGGVFGGCESHFDTFESDR